jgi:hypothetical protein
MQKPSAISLPIRSQELYNAVPIRIGEIHLWPSPLNQRLRLSELHAKRCKNSKQHHGASMLAFLAVDVDSGFRLPVGGKGKVHYPLEQFGLFNFKVIAEGAP